MARGYDIELRERVVAAHTAGVGGAHQLAALFDLGYRTVQRWVARKRTTGSVAPAPPGGGWKSAVDPALLTTLIREVPDSTAAELCVEYNRRVGRRGAVSAWAIDRARRRLGFVCKKNARGRPKWIVPTSGRNAGRFSGG